MNAYFVHVLPRDLQKLVQNYLWFPVGSILRLEQGNDDDIFHEVTEQLGFKKTADYGHTWVQTVYRLSPLDFCPFLNQSFFVVTTDRWTGKWNRDARCYERSLGEVTFTEETRGKLPTLVACEQFEA